MISPASSFGPLSTVRYSVGGVSFDMVRVPPGRLFDGDGLTRRELLVSRPFELGVTSVTQALWRAVMDSSPSAFRGEDRPVEQVSWRDTQQFMGALAARGLPGFRLPTEAEWAWAARCGAPTWWAGADRVRVVTAVDPRGTAAVARLSGSAAGLFDLSGNVFEWVGDWFEQVPLAGVDVQGSASGSYRVGRGGSWSDGLLYTRVAVRGYDAPGSSANDLGVRLARTVP